MKSNTSRMISSRIFPIGDDKSQQTVSILVIFFVLLLVRYSCAGYHIIENSGDSQEIEVGKLTFLARELFISIGDGILHFFHTIIMSIRCLVKR